VIDAVGSADEALARAATTPYAAALLDLVMPGATGPRWLAACGP